MIISPPFLPAHGAEPDATWLNTAMAAPTFRVRDTGAPEGSFPLGHNLMWHNGMHIQAPLVDGVAAPARAIADGTVIFANRPKTANTNVDDAQNYNPFDTPGSKTPAWTDNGCVIIEHRTTIGAQGAAETEVVFYSLYMHLSTLGRITPPGQTTARVLRAGDAIWRKDAVGAPGAVYGHLGQIHFEVCLDAANLQRLIGRVPNWVEPAAAPATLPAPTQDGRTDSIFGSLYFYLPASTPTRSGNTLPTEHIRGAAVPGATTLGTPIWVKMTYHLGACTFESYDEQGRLIRALPAKADVEYDLYQTATRRHGALSATDQASSSPSGWYELLRFGRNIGRGTAATDKDPLPANATHWRFIPGPTGTEIWADLNAPGTFKFSDSDFLPVMGWNCIDDDTSPDDQRCDSLHLKTLVRDPDAGNANRMEVDALARRLGQADVQSKLKRVLCKFPSEWDKGSITARYGFVKDLQPFTEAPEAWPRLEAHLNAISFDALPAAYLSADWRGHPREFIECLRKCGWLSVIELAQTFPRHLFYTTAGTRTAITTPASVYSLARATAVERVSGHSIDINRTMRKYSITSAQRQAHFLAQVMLETAQWRNIPPNRLLMHEWGFGAYSAANPMTEFYTAFYGRGIMQLTWVGNYRDYGNYRSNGALHDNNGNYVERLTPNAPRISQTSLHWTGNPAERATQVIWGPRYDPDIIATDPFNACDSGGFYWVSKHHSGEININRVCDRDFSPASVGRVNTLVNGGGNGYYERQAYAAFMLRFLSDSTEVAADVELQPPLPKSRVRANFLKST